MWYDISICFIMCSMYDISNCLVGCLFMQYEYPLTSGSSSDVPTSLILFCIEIRT